MWMYHLWKFSYLLNLIVKPCFRDAFPTSRTLCGILDGTLRRWVFRVNFVEVIQWVNSLKLRLRRRSQHFNNRMRCWINTSIHKLNPISTTSMQQLIPFHQPPSASFPSTPQPSAPQAPDPPAHAATPATQYGPSTPFNPDEILQQMKSTVESSIQAMVEKTQAQYPNSPKCHTRTIHQPSSSNMQHQLPRQRSPRRSPRRSRSHHHGYPPRRPDERPVSTRRSPRRRRSSRRHRRSSRNRSHSRSHSHRRHDSSRRERESSITLKSASPQRREDIHALEEYHQPPDYSSQMPTLQASSKWQHQYSIEDNKPKGDTYHPEHSSGSKWQSWGTWKNYPKNSLLQVSIYMERSQAILQPSRSLPRLYHKTTDSILHFQIHSHTPEPWV